MRFHLIVWMESQEEWHDVDEINVPRKHRHDALSYAMAVARNTHPRLRGLWAVVPIANLDEAMARDPRKGLTLAEEYGALWTSLGYEAA